MDIELGDAVAVVRQELLEAAGRGAGAEVGFVVGPIELEFAVELRADAQVKAGFRAWVLSADAQVGVARGRTHTVKVTLIPKNVDGTDVLIAGEAGTDFGPGDVSGHLGR